MELPPPDEQLEFLEYVKAGSGVLTACYALNWTPAKLKKLMSDPSFKEAYDQTMLMQVESIEEVVYQLALRRNTKMIELYLFNKAPDRWAPPTQRVKIDKTTRHEVEVVGNAVEVARQLLQERGAVAAIQAGAIEAQARDLDD